MSFKEGGCEGDFEPNNEIGFICNPCGPWNQLEDERLKQALLRLAATHKLECQNQTGFTDFKDVVDAFVLSWIQKQVQVEDVAIQRGFTPCEDMSTLPPSDRRKAAVLALSLNGSFCLFGNGCLMYRGGSGHYEKIPYRRDEGAVVRKALQGVRCMTIPKVGSSLQLNQSRLKLKHTSAVHDLYYTTNQLTDEGLLQIGQEVSEVISQNFLGTIGQDLDETSKGIRRRIADVPQHNPLVPKTVEVAP